MASLEARGYVNKLEVKESKGGKPYARFDLAVAQKRKDRLGQEVHEKLYIKVTDFDPKDLPAEGDYVGVTGYATIFPWAANGKNGVNIEVSVKSYEKLPQRPKTPGGGSSPAGRQSDNAPPSDPFALSPNKP